ncbi:MAG: lipopolysaccharide biosynthesis protein [Gemmatimonadales bacterium]
MAWTAMVKWGGQVLSWVALIFLARLLRPEDYGLVGLAGLYLGFVSLLTEGGLGSTIVIMRQMTKDEIAQFNSVAALMGAAGSILTCFAAYPLGWYFDSTALPAVVLALSVNATLSALRIVPIAILQRQLRFRSLAAVDGIQAITSTAATLGLALAGWSYWALVGGSLLGSMAATATANRLSPQPFSTPRRGSLGQYVHFTRDLLVGRIAWFVYSNADFVVAGRTLGTAALGMYTFAWNIASTPVEKVSALVSRVTPSILSRLKGDRAELAGMFVAVTEGLVYLTLPASIGLAIVARDFVAVYLGPQWGGAVVPLQILAVYATFRSVATLPAQVLTALGDTRFLMINGLATAITMPVSFVLGSRWGAPGIAAVWLLVYPIHTIVMFRRAFRGLDLATRTYFAAMFPAARATAIMAATIFAVRFLESPGMSAPVRLAVEVGGGAVAFVIFGIVPRIGRIRQIAARLRAPDGSPLADPQGSTR